MLDSEESVDWWREEIHFVVDDGWSADWLGVLNNDYYTPNEFVLWSAAIDRDSDVREVGIIVILPPDGNSVLHFYGL